VLRALVLFLESPDIQLAPLVPAEPPICRNGDAVDDHLLTGPVDLAIWHDLDAETLLISGRSVYWHYR
jgi:hypothetical protein